MLEFLRIINENMTASKNFYNKNDKFLLRLARDLTFIGVFGLQVAFNYRDTLVIEDLRKNGIKLYMLSGEDNDNVQTDCALNYMSTFGRISTGEHFSILFTIQNESTQHPL